MYSKHHLVLSVLAGAALLPFVDVTVTDATVTPFLVVAYAGALGVGIDFDHFVVARLNTGSWRAARVVLRNPTLAFVGQDDIFEDGEVGTLKRLLSHAVLAGVLVLALLAAGAVGLAVVSGVVLYVHVLADLAWDVHGELARQ